MNEYDIIMYVFNYLIYIGVFYDRKRKKRNINKVKRLFCR